MDGCGKISNCMSLSILIDIAVTQILLNCLIGLERFRKHDAIQIKGLANNNTAT